MNQFDSRINGVCEIEPVIMVDPMDYEQLRYSFNQIDKAGIAIRNRDRASFKEALDVLFNWRSAHRYPLHILYMTMKKRAKKVDPRALTAQRLKRIESIFRKILRNPTMQLSQMQDVGGCRSIIHSQKALIDLVDIYKSQKLRHELKGIKDYIANPKSDGYRSVHLMYRFVGYANTCQFHKLRIEIQLRTKLQHSWATAVETVDTFTGEDIKFGSGSDDWRRFFQLMGSVHAHLERTQPVPDTPSELSVLRKEIRALEGKLNIVNMLHSWAYLTKHIRGRKTGTDYWYLIEIRPTERTANIETFPPDKADEANERYKETELKNKGTSNNTALVSVNKLSNLEKTYPNYFADTAVFTSSVTAFLAAPDSKSS